jgi:hypothetical protein
LSLIADLRWLLWALMLQLRLRLRLRLRRRLWLRRRLRLRLRLCVLCRRDPTSIMKQQRRWCGRDVKRPCDKVRHAADESRARSRLPRPCVERCRPSRSPPHGRHREACSTAQEKRATFRYSLRYFARAARNKIAPRSGAKRRRRRRLAARSAAVGGKLRRVD